MQNHPRFILLAATLLAAAFSAVSAAPIVSRLTPPSDLFSFKDPSPPYISRFLPGQRFDLQATISPDAAQNIAGVKFYVNNSEVPGVITLVRATVTTPALPANTLVATLRAENRTTFWTWTELNAASAK